MCVCVCVCVNALSLILSTIQQYCNIYSSINSPSELVRTINLLYIYKQDLTLNNLQGLICHKTQSTQIPTNLSQSIHIYLSAYLSKLADRSRGRPESSLFNSC